MSAKTIGFLSNDDVLTMVSAYMTAMDETPNEDLVVLIQSVLKDYKPREAARLLDIPIARIYDYRREDWLTRRAHNKYSNVFLRDFVKIVMLGNMASR